MIGFTPKNTEKNMVNVIVSTSVPVNSNRGSRKWRAWVEYFAALSHFRLSNVLIWSAET